jgi:hypothetical protein
MLKFRELLQKQTATNQVISNGNFSDFFRPEVATVPSGLSTTPLKKIPPQWHQNDILSLPLKLNLEKLELKPYKAGSNAHSIDIGYGLDDRGIGV